ncbi:unnamed protein product [Spirodela intermedia]|uniref:Peroxidase n=1 Tax=Spirodela intermedia TaxID=51605 RepID=A0A7I8JTT1_SPIIN|nr:unnamed protein product [Spirodela intermedia]CAA6673023.1 unnamed protein product [Spirodela intermedia]
MAATCKGLNFTCNGRHSAACRPYLFPPHSPPVGVQHTQLRPNFFSSTCPNLHSIIENAVWTAVKNDLRLSASMICLFFHDCFVNGCDASVLLVDTATFQGEQTDIIELIKSTVEESCNGIVSCADILALATRDGVVLSGGPSWTVMLGRRDATTANKITATEDLPFSRFNLSLLITNFAKKGLNLRELVALSGAHTVGFATCRAFRNRIYNDTNIDTNFANSDKAICPPFPPEGDGNLSPLDVNTWTVFDNEYYKNLVSLRGLLHSDQELFNNGDADPIVQSYLGSISPLTGSSGEIRRVCSRVN